MWFRFACCNLLLVLLAVALTTPAAAQTLYGSLTGNLSDASGAAVPNAKVEVTNVGTGVVKTAQTDERGAYSFNDLQPGSYKVVFSAPAFSTRIVEGVLIAQNTTLRLDSTRHVFQVQAINASTVTLQTDRADINNVIRSNQMTDLPLINSQGRNFQSNT